MTLRADAHPVIPNAGDVGRRDFVASMLGAAAWLALPGVHHGERESADYTLLSDVMVTMRDGVRLATDVYIPVESAAPAGTRRFPVILERTPYNKTAPSRSERTPTMRQHDVEREQPRPSQRGG